MADDTRDNGKADAATIVTGAVEPTKALPKGVVLDKDGKPCRSCTSFASWAALSKSTLKKPAATEQAHASTSTPAQPPPDCPADVETLGRSTWTFLHTMAAAYPEHPSPTQQSDLFSFVRLFSRLYPCWVCAEDFQGYIARETPKVGSRAEFGNWLCEAHNEVNRKLGKKRFDCAKWEERWRTGWKDGRCD